jgi:hypothetical protein
MAEHLDERAGWLEGEIDFPVENVLQTGLRAQSAFA